MNNNTHRLAVDAIRSLDRFEGNLEDAVVARCLRFKANNNMTDSQANALYYAVMDAAENTTLEDRAQYLKEVSEDTEKWYDPMTCKTYWVTNRDFDNANPSK